MASLTKRVSGNIPEKPQGKTVASFFPQLKKIFAKIKLVVKNINIGYNSGTIGDNNEKHEHRK